MTLFSAEFRNLKYPSSICELVFKNANLNFIGFSYFTNSYYKINLLKFEKQSENFESLNSNIPMVQIDKFFEIHIDSSLLNENVFEKTNIFILAGKINSIQVDLFKNFQKLNLISFHPVYFIEIVRKQGIDWIKAINSDINVNLSDYSEISKNLDKIKRITFNMEREFYYDKNFQFVYDEDFCLFKDFPFNQMVVYSLIEREMPIKYGCTDLWLVKNNWLFKSSPYDFFDIDNFVYLHVNFFECEFEKRLDLCNKTNFVTKTSNSENVLDFMIVSEFLLILFNVMISLFGIVSQVIVIIVIVKKENRKELKEKQYVYIAFHSAANIAIFFFQIMSLISECQLPFGIYCSSIRKLIFVQYLNIIFVQYFNFFFRLLSNFFYVGFSINRLSLVGSNQDKKSELASKISIKTFIAVSLLISAGLSVVKGFLFKINLYFPEMNYPIIFSQKIYNWQLNLNYRFILIFNFVYDMINYVLFVVIHFVIDIILVVKFRRVISERENKLKNMNANLKEKLHKENEESVRRVIKMVILNSTVNIFCKIPMTITSLNDLRLMIQRGDFKNIQPYFEYLHWFTFSYNMKYICSSDRICEIFQSFGNLLYLISLSLSIVFLKSFDKKFQNAFQQTFFSKTPVMPSLKPN